MVELRGDVPRQFQMLLLVLPHRHMGGAVEQDVGGHQRWIGKEPDGRGFLVLPGLLLELRHPRHPPHAGDAVEHPRQLGMFGHLALVEDDMFLRIDTGGEKRGGHLADVARQFQRVLGYGDGVQVDHAIDALHLVLQGDEAFDGTEIVAQMQIAGRLDSGKNSLVHNRQSPGVRFEAFYDVSRLAPQHFEDSPVDPAGQDGSDGIDRQTGTNDGARIRQLIGKTTVGIVKPAIEPPHHDAHQNTG